MKVGVLALQGDFREHIAALDSCDVDVYSVRRPDDLGGLDGLVLPGGESTAIVHLAKSFGLFQPIRDSIEQGLPVYGSCAGMILLADKILDAAKGQETFGGLNATVRRNAFGRQVDSFESDIDFLGSKIRAVFIRAPWVEEVGTGTDVLASVTLPDGSMHPVAIANKTLLATSFHPEITGDSRVHRHFIDHFVAPSLKR